MALSFSRESTSKAMQPLTNSVRENSNGTFALSFHAKTRETISKGSRPRASNKACSPSGPILSSARINGWRGNKRCESQRVAIGCEREKGRGGNVTVRVLEVGEEVVDGGDIDVVARRSGGTGETVGDASHRGARGGLCGMGRGLGYGFRGACLFDSAFGGAAHSRWGRKGEGRGPGRAGGGGVGYDKLGNGRGMRMGGMEGEVEGVRWRKSKVRWGGGGMVEASRRRLIV